MEKEFGGLPEGWVVTNLDNILLSIIGGGTPSKSNPDYFQGHIPWMSVKDMNKGVLEDTVDHISSEAVDNSSTNVIPAGTPIVATRMSLGKIVIANFDSAINQDLKALFLSKYISRDFLVYWYRSVSQIVISLGTGTTVKGIRLESLKALNLSLPSAGEQKVIAEKLDSLLAQVDSIKTRLDQIPQILKRFRQAVLSAAVSGNLLNNQKSDGSNLDNSYQSWHFGNLPDKWGIDYYGNLVESRLGKMLDKAKNNGIATHYLGNINVRWFSFDLDGLQKILISAKELNELTLNYGDVLICEGGEPGRSAIWKECDKSPLIFQKALHRARVGPCLIPEWLVLNLKNDANRRTLEQLFTGTTIKHLTGKALQKYPLRIPPIEEQTEIVARVEKLFAWADNIEKQVNAAQQRVNNLTQSTLAKAFRGELTEQWRKDHPELISGENSAAALLAKIKAERVAQTKKSKKKA